ncbi:hypothetical protein N9W34_02275 [Rickettsiales bacterium]|nr:hypothetical protein [Rickettsiales bacterium]
MNEPDTTEKHEKTYNAIVKFYDFAEALVDSVEHEAIEDPLSQLEFIEPLVDDIEESTDILTEEYRNFVRTGKKPGMFARKRIEKSLGKIYAAINLCKKQKQLSSED